ncbi:MAG: HDOD domain-containing protein [Phycisphaerales bacterium]
MKVRRLLSAGEVTDLHLALQGKLETVGLCSQPEVALKLLELSNNPRAQLNDYAKLIQNDQAIAGRVLRLANSAFFAQRKPVTAIDRACIVLGVDRLKAVSLGFSLSRAAQSPSDKDYSRKIWGESLFRACMASQLARLTAPGLLSEAFVIGLMMDAGLPLMMKLLGDKYQPVFANAITPGRIYRAEFDTLEFTHVDLIVAMITRWKLPELLVKPIEWHHTKPAEAKRDDPLSRLHRIAYVVGLIELTQRKQQIVPVSMTTPGVQTAQRLLSLTDTELTHVVKQSFGEYSATSEMFKEVAQAMESNGDIMEMVQLGLARAVDNVIELELSQAMDAKPARMVLGGRVVEVVRESDGATMAYLYDSEGRRMLSHRFVANASTPNDVCEALGIEKVHTIELEKLGQAMTRLAA